MIVVFPDHSHLLFSITDRSRAIHVIGPKVAVTSVVDLFQKEQNQ